jgi:tRNA(Ile)-lysidine synthase
LRAWLAGHLPHGVPETLVARLESELPAVRCGRWPAAPGTELALYRGLLQIATPARRTATTTVMHPASEGLDLSRPGDIEIPPWPGRLVVSPAGDEGVAAGLLRGLRACCRAGPERFRLAPNGEARSLKKQYQARGIPAWARDGPLLFTADGRLLFVPGLGVDAGLQAEPGEPRLALHWVAEPSPVPGDPQAAG